MPGTKCQDDSVGDTIRAEISQNEHSTRHWQPKREPLCFHSSFHCLEVDELPLENFGPYLMFMDLLLELLEFLIDLELVNFVQGALLWFRYVSSCGLLSCCCHLLSIGSSLALQNFFVDRMSNFSWVFHRGQFLTSLRRFDKHSFGVLPWLLSLYCFWYGLNCISSSCSCAWYAFFISRFLWHLYSSSTSPLPKLWTKLPERTN